MNSTIGRYQIVYELEQGEMVLIFLALVFAKSVIG